MRFYGLSKYIGIYRPHSNCHSTAYGAGTQTRIALYTTSYLIDSQIDTLVAGGNSALFINSLNWICAGKQTVSIAAKGMSVDYLVLSSRDVTLWSTLFIGVLPALVLTAGGIVWYRRRKR